MIYVTDPEVVALVHGWSARTRVVLRKSGTWRMPGRLRLARLWLYLALAELAG